MSPRLNVLVTVAVLGAAVAAGVACYRDRLAEPPWVIEARNDRPHACDRPGCDACEGYRTWLRDNPGRHHGDLLEAAEAGLGIIRDAGDPEAVRASQAVAREASWPVRPSRSAAPGQLGGADRGGAWSAPGEADK